MVNYLKNKSLAPCLFSFVITVLSIVLNMVLDILMNNIENVCFL